MTTTRRTKKADHETGPRVIVVGAGYAGLLAALRLAPHARVTLVDPSDRFTERIRLHELAAARPDASHPLADLLRGTGVRHVARRATAIDPAARTVTTDGGGTLPYDRLVYALGSRTGAGDGREPEGRVHTAETAEALRQRLRHGSGTLAVVGGGLTGIEMAAELAETYPDWKVRLLTAGSVATGHSDRGRAHVHKVLTARGVRIEEGVAVPDADAVDADAVVWAGSMVPNTDLAAAAGLKLAPATGRVEVDDALRSVSHPEVLAVGDAAAGHSSQAGELRMGCAAALPTGSQAASAIIAEQRGQEPKPLKFRYVLQCVSLGRRDALIQFVRPDDSPHDRVLTGRTAAGVKEQIVRSTLLSLRLARRSPDLFPRITGMG
ncbi:NAD(P)/FAD-dependent oxidoreductase [Streptomyces sp. NPDC020412]|uniref:NAD(P)/FAD-dependent oxidoreductase n=1 Tax=Streptomyces sp. NPDC020412 TaxID=3365073 RepID=UPI0037992460